MGQQNKEVMANDIIVPQSYYHVTKSFNQINGLVTTGAATCTALAMSASNENGEIIYALTHIDGENDIKKVIDGMIEDMNTQINGIVGTINAYIASAGIKNNGNLAHTPEKVVDYLNQKNVALKFASNLQQIRIGGSSKKDDIVRVSEGVDEIHRAEGNKNLDGLIQQANALPKMKGGHNKWTELKQEGGYSSGVHDPMEEVIKQVLDKALYWEKETEVNDNAQQQKLTNLKSAIKKEENWYKKYLYGRKLLAWADTAQNQ
ncbi:hypothetical protein [Nostoc piscinale]|uniref:hypothetical protein n=1 Tax=Nostoc piscinale TaxID=224012 RepID=UPI000AD32E05|nr:hypothetical protein [Nostoc piscinale]